MPSDTKQITQQKIAAQRRAQREKALAEGWEWLLSPSRRMTPRQRAWRDRGQQPDSRESCRRRRQAERLAVKRAAQAVQP